MMIKHYRTPLINGEKQKQLINESNTDERFLSIYSIVIWNIQKSLGQDSGWITDSVIGHNINTSKYNS